MVISIQCHMYWLLSEAQSYFQFRCDLQPALVSFLTNCLNSVIIWADVFLYGKIIPCILDFKAGTFSVQLFSHRVSEKQECVVQTHLVVPSQSVLGVLVAGEEMSWCWVCKEQPQFAVT